MDSNQSSLLLAQLAETFNRSGLGAASTQLPPQNNLASKIKEYQEQNDSKVIIFNEQTKSVLSLWENREEINLKDAQKFINILHNLDPQKKLDIILNTRGGDLGAVEVITNALLNHQGQIDFHINDYTFEQVQT